MLDDAFCGFVLRSCSCWEADQSKAPPPLGEAVFHALLGFAIDVDVLFASAVGMTPHPLYVQC